MDPGLSDVQQRQSISLTAGHRHPVLTTTGLRGRGAISPTRRLSSVSNVTVTAPTPAPDLLIRHVPVALTEIQKYRYYFTICTPTCITLVPGKRFITTTTLALLVGRLRQLPPSDTEVSTADSRLCDRARAFGMFRIPVAGTPAPVNSRQYYYGACVEIGYPGESDTTNNCSDSPGNC